MTQDWISSSVVLTNESGLHARPAVKLTQLAKTSVGPVEIAASAEGPWVDAKSPVRLMRFRAPSGTRLFVRAAGSDAEQMIRRIVALAERNFDEEDERAGSHG